MTSSNIEFKAMPGQVNVDEAQGIVECFVAGIGNKDSVGDVLIAGAFTKSLTRRKPRVVWGHNWNDPIGKVLEIYEVAPGDRRLPVKMLNAGIGGLYARVQFNLNSEKGKEAFANIAFFGQEQEWSIGYKTLDAIFDPNLQANILKEVELYEVSPVLHGANQLTGTISVKSDDAVALAESEKGWGMMGPHHMMGQMPQRPTMIMVRENDDDYESEKPIFSEGLSQPIDGDKKQRLEKEIMERTGSPVRLMSATESTAIFQRMMPNGAPMNFRIGYHTPDNYSTFMFGKPELIKNTDNYSSPNNNPSGSRVITPTQMPSMQIQVKPGYEQDYEKSDIASQLLDLEEILMSEVDEKVGKTINKRNLSKLKQIIENLQEVISSAEKEDLETKGYLIPVELHEAFHAKSLLDPILDYHRVESQVTENGILITSGVTKDLIDAIDNAQKGIGRTLGGKPGKGRAAGRAAFSRFDPKAWDGDGDGLVQEGTPFQRPAIPGVNDRSTRGRVNAQAATQAFTQQGGFASTSGGSNDFNRQIKPEQRVIDSAVKMLEKNREYIADRMMPGRNREILDENWVDETIKNLKKGEISHLDAMNIMNLVADIVSRKINEDPSLRDATSGEVFQYQKLSKRLRRAMVAGVSPEDMDNIRRGQGITRSQVSKPSAFGSTSKPSKPLSASTIRNIDIRGIDDAIEELAAKDIGLSFSRYRQLKDEGRLPERYEKAFTDRVQVLNEIFRGLSKEKLDKSPGTVISEIRKKLVDSLSSERNDSSFIQGFNDRKELQNFIDGIENIVELALVEYSRAGDEESELADDLMDDFRESLQKISEKSKELFNARSRSLDGRMPKDAKKTAELEKERLFDLLKNPLNIEELVDYLDSTDGVIPTNVFLDRIKKGNISDEDLVEINGLLEDALEHIITLDPSLDPEKLAKEFSDAFREGGKNDESGVIQRIAKELGDDGVSEGLVQYLKDGKENSPFLPDRGKKEREILRGFASSSGRMDREEDGADYDEAFGPRGRRTNRGMREDPVGEGVTERLDRDSQNAAVRQQFASSSGSSGKERLSGDDFDENDALTAKGRKKVFDYLVDNGTSKDEADSIMDRWEQNDGTAEEYMQKYSEGDRSVIKNIADAASSMYEDDISNDGERQAERRYYQNENRGFASRSDDDIPVPGTGRTTRDFDTSRAVPMPDEPDEEIMESLREVEKDRNSRTSSRRGEGTMLGRSGQISRDEQGNVDPTEGREARAAFDQNIFNKLRELGFDDEQIELLTGVPDGGRTPEGAKPASYFASQSRAPGKLSENTALRRVNRAISENGNNVLDSDILKDFLSGMSAEEINEKFSLGNPRDATNAANREINRIRANISSKANSDMDLLIYLESGFSVKDTAQLFNISPREVRKRQKQLKLELGKNIEEDDLLYLRSGLTLEQTGKVLGIEPKEIRRREQIALKTRGSSRGNKIGRKKQTRDGTLTPQKNLSITLDDDLVGLLNEEVGMLLDNTKNREPLLLMKKILEESKGGKFEVTPEQFDNITAAIEDAFENGVVTSDVYGVLHQAAESLDGKYDLNEINNPKKAKGFASSGRRANNGAPTDMTELQQRQYVMWARQQRGLRVAQEIIQEHDRNNGQMPAPRWKALRTMYSNMASQGPRRSPGFASRDRTSRPTAGVRDVGTSSGGPLPYVYITTGWKKVGGAGGLNDAGKYTDPKTGKTYYVKHSASGEEFRGESEILTSKLYQLLGVGTINYERGVHNGKLQRVSEWNPGIKTIGRNHGAKSRDPKFKASVQESLIANAWLANWDGTGNMDNIVEGPNGEAIMADSGGGLLFRAQAWNGMKGQGGTDSFGPKVEEVFNLINGKTRSGQSVQGGVSNAYYKDIEPSEVARQVKELSQVTDEDIKKLVSQTISNKADGDRLAEILIARRDWIVDHWSTGQLVEKPQDTSRSDASGSRVRPFASSSAGSRRAFASTGIDGAGDDGPGSGRVIRARGLGEAVPGGAIEGRERASGGGQSRGDNTGLETRFAGKSFDETKPDNWDELTLDEKWNWALTEGNPENNKTEERMSPVAYKKLLTDLGEESDKEELARMSPAQRREERRIRKQQDAEIEEMGDPESKEEVKRRTEQSKPKEPKKPAVTKIKKSENAQQAKEERTKRLDAFIDFINDKKSEIETDEYEVDDHRELWDKVSTALQEGGYDFNIKSLGAAIAVLDDYVGSFEDEQLTPGEKKNLQAAKKMLRTLISAKTAYESDEWINGGKGSGTKPTAFASSGRQIPGMPPVSKEAIEARKQMEKLISDTKKDIKKMQGTGKPGSRGFASTSSSGKTMITDEATFFQDIESSIVKEIRRARKAQDAKAVKGLTKLEEIIKRDEASKTGSRRTNVGSIYFTMEEADQILDGLMFALDSQLEDGGEKRIAWYSKLIELIAKSAKSTFIDKTTSEIGKTTRTGTNSRGQTRTIKTIPDA